MTNASFNVIHNIKHISIGQLCKLSKLTKPFNGPDISLIKGSSLYMYCETIIFCGQTIFVDFVAHLNH